MFPSSPVGGTPLKGYQGLDKRVESRQVATAPSGMVLGQGLFEDKSGAPEEPDQTLVVVKPSRFDMPAIPTGRVSVES